MGLIKVHRITQQRKSILEIINRLGHATLPEIQDNLTDKGENIALSTIYRSLETLENENVIRRIPSKYGQDFYEFYEQAKHDHFVCLKCGKIYDIPKKRTNVGFLAKEGKYVQEVVTTYYGICNDCHEDN